MNDKDLTKKKNDLMKSILGHPKLSKTFRDAVSAPIGSTKREQAKSVLSIMRKVGGLRNDGAGGPIMDAAQNQTSSTPDYSNMMIFPAAPAFKKKQAPAPQPQAQSNDGKGGTTDFNFGNLNTGFSSSPTIYEAPTQVNQLAGLGKVASAAGNLIGEAGYNFGTGVGAVASMLDPFQASPNINFSGALSPYGSVANSTPTIAGKYGTISNVLGSTTPTTPTTPAVYGPVYSGPVQSAVSGANAKVNGSTTQTQTQNNTGGSTSGSTQTPQTPAPTGANADVAAALKAGTGATAFSMDYADAKFGGSLDQYMVNLDAKLKKDFNLEPLEQQLSDLKAAGGNLIPTLQNYMLGKDQYLKAINTLIDKSEADLTHTNMADPFTANQYTNNLAYLYTLKGRQNQRYGNFLNSAIADYNADVTKLQSNYENVYKDYTAAMTQQGGMAQNTYNNLVTRMSAAYTELEQAPIKMANLSLLNQQIAANNAASVGNGLAGLDTTNPKTWADMTEYTKQITVQNGTTDPLTGTLDMTKVNSMGGLVGVYDLNAHNGGDQRVMTNAISAALSNTIAESGNDPKVIAQVKKLISDLQASSSGYDDEGKAQISAWASALGSVVSAPAKSSLSGFIKSNLPAVKSAVEDLVKGGSGFLWTGLGARKSGIEDKEGWMKDHASLDKAFLEQLYETVTNNDPSTYVKNTFVGTDQEIADNLAKDMSI